MTYDPIKIRYKTLKNGNRSIYLDYRVDGKRVVEYVKMYLLPGRSPQVRHINRHILQAVAHIKAQRLTNIAWSRQPNDGVAASKRPLLDLIDEYIAYRIRRGSTSARSTYGALKHHVSLLNPDIRLWQVDLDFVTSLAHHMMHHECTPSGRPLAHSTVSGTISSLGSVLRYAVLHRMVRSNPVDLFDKRMLQGPVYQRTYLLADELRALVRTPCPVPLYKQLFLFACFVGLRYSDLLTLRWSDIIEESGTVRIEKMMHKTRHMVYIPLCRVALDYLPQRQSPDALVFPALPSSSGPIDTVLRQWVADAGIRKQVTFYTARHTFATLSLNQGADLYVVSKLLGHQEIRTTQGYASIVDHKRTEAMYRIDTLFPEYLS